MEIIPSTDDDSQFLTSQTLYIIEAVIFFLNNIYIQNLPQPHIYETSFQEFLAEVYQKKKKEFLAKEEITNLWL